MRRNAHLMRKWFSRNTRASRRNQRQSISLNSPNVFQSGVLSLDSSERVKKYTGEKKVALSSGGGLSNNPNGRTNGRCTLHRQWLGYWSHLQSIRLATTP